MHEIRSYAMFCDSVKDTNVVKELGVTPEACKFGELYLDEKIIKLYLTSLRFDGADSAGASLSYDFALRRARLLLVFDTQRVTTNC